MSLIPSDRAIITDELGREPTNVEAALFENLWSEHCAYRSSQPLLTAFDTEGPQVVIGPGDDAAVVAVPTKDVPLYITLGIESHNHPSYVDPFDGAATGVGGIVRDTMSMGAYPIALADSLYFGDFAETHTKYLFEGVVEGISHYGNCIGVPTVAGSVSFHDGYEGNPLVNVACIGLTNPDRLLTAEATQPGNKLVLVGNATGRDGLGGASFASEDLDADAETEDRPAVQVGDPYAEKLLIEANEELLDAEIIHAARDLGAAGLGGASSEMVAKGDLGATISLDAVHQREPNMSALEILLAESQERMCYEVSPEDVEEVKDIVHTFDLQCSVIGEVTSGNYVCTFHEETVVDVPAALLAEGAPMNDLAYEQPQPPTPDVPNVNITAAFEQLVASPNTASKEWVYRQYDYEVGAKTVVGPGDDAAVLALRDVFHENESGDSNPGIGLAFTAGADPNWTACAPYDGARGVVLENATNLAVKGANPLAAVNCLNGGNPEKPAVYGGFQGIVNGLADMCISLDIPVVGGNVSLYNDSPTGPIPPTPTIAMTGTKAGFETPPSMFQGEGEIVLLSAVPDCALGGSEYLALFGGADTFPELLPNPQEVISAIADIADLPSTLATHDISHGGLAITLAEMVHENGAVVSVGDDFEDGTMTELLFSESPGRVIVETSDIDAIRDRFDGVGTIYKLGESVPRGELTLNAGAETISTDWQAISTKRSIIDHELA